MSKLIFIRHSQVQIDPARPSREWPLSADGRLCCHQLLPTLAAHHPSRIFTSDEAKAAETGQILADGLGLPHQTALNLHEHEREGVPYYDSQEAFHAVVEKIFRQPDLVNFGNESANETFLRFDTAVHKLIRQYPDDNLAIATHGTVLTLFLAHYNQFDPFPFWKSLQLPDMFVVGLPDMKLRRP